MNHNQPVSDNSRADVDFFAGLGDVPAAIWQRKWHVLATLVATLVLGVLYLLLATPLYIAQARVVIERKELPLQGRQYRGESEFLATQVEVMRSPEVLRSAMQALGLPAPEVSEVTALSAMLKSLTVNPVLGTNVLNIGYRCDVPDDAIRILQAVIGSYREYAQTLDQEAHNETLKLLKESEQQLREEVARLQDQYHDIHKRSPLLGHGKDASSVQHDVLLHLAQKLTEAKNRRIDLENQLYAQSSSPAPQHSAPTAEARELQPEAPRLFHPAVHRVWQHDAGMPEGEGGTPLTRDLAKIQDELWRAKVRFKQLGQNYGPKHPEVRAVKDQISLWEGLLSDSASANTMALEQELAAARLNESRISELYRAEFDNTKELDDYVLNEQRMAGDLLRVQSIHDSTLTKLRQWELDDQVLATGKGGVTVLVIEDPVNAVPRKLWPRSTLVLAACMAFGLIGGAGLASALDYLAHRRPLA